MGASETEARQGDLGERFSGSDEELVAEIERLTGLNRANRERERERRLLGLRHLAGKRLIAEDRGTPAYPDPAPDVLPEAEGLPEVAAADVTPELLRAGILRDGCLLVRGLVDRAQALAFAQQIDRAIEVRDRYEDGTAPAEPGYYEEFQAFPAWMRSWIRQGGGLLAADTPMLSFEMMEMLAGARVPDLVAGYLGEPAAISADKTTLRKADPGVVGAWHQDGAFMGDVRALNLWLSLSRCGDEAPGLDIVPRRLDHLVATGTDGTQIDNQVSQEKAEEAAGDLPIVRPIFEPGDAVLFDDLCLHQTASDPSMPKPRFAIESWFFGASAFPGDYAPIAV
jgi:hypothetical protein